jgi:superfamily II DNA or RNA helicase
MAKNYLKVIRWAQQADTIILGVTATPCRADQQSFRYATDPDTKELYEVFQVMVECDDIGTLINDGWLVRPSVYAPEIKGITDTPGRLVDGEFILKELAELRDKPQITGDAIEHYKKYCPSRPPTIVFCVSVAHAQHCAMEFTQAGIPSESIDGSMDDDQRAAIIGRVESGRTVCLMSCDLVSEGFDLPAMSCAIMLRDIGPKSLSLFMQQVGRILRPSPGKTEAILLDHVENWIRHGFVEEKRDWFETFNGTKKRAPKSKGATLSRCPKCFSVFPPVPKCPACGHDLRPPAGEGGGREIETADGELVKLNTAEILNLRSAAPITGRRKTLIQKLERA